jgi:hypothetical protein
MRESRPRDRNERRSDMIALNNKQARSLAEAIEQADPI